MIYLENRFSRGAASTSIFAFAGTFGVQPGQRRNHVKGTCAAGEFVGTDAATLSRSTLFSGKTIPVVARYHDRRTDLRRSVTGSYAVSFAKRLSGEAGSPLHLSIKKGHWTRARM